MIMQNPPSKRNDSPMDDPEESLDLDRTHDLPTSSRADELAAVIDSYVEHLRKGNPPNRAEVIKRHPQFARELDECLASVEFIHAIEPEDQIISKRIGDFQVIREIGRGGMGAVYEAKQVSLNRTVALKVLRFGSVSDGEAVNRFQREAETVADLHHTNIVPIFSVGREQGVNYYAMQLIDGKSLDRIANEPDRQIDTKTAADWGLQAAEALTHAHQRDVIHRDVKPSNLILDRDGRIWLSDFGLAKRSDDVTLSVAGTLLGTPRYMSPEQAEAATRTIDHRSDIYSLGATLYELVTGQPVFAAETPHGIINQILTKDPVAPRKHKVEISRDFETILLKCLSKNASQRYSSASELAEDLRAIGEDRPIRARRPRIIERSSRWLRERKRAVTAAGSATLATLACLGLIIGGQHLLRKSRETTLQLTTASLGLVAEIDNGNTTTFQSLPTQEPLKLEAGDVSMHISGDGHLSQRLDVALAPDDGKTLQVSVDDQRIGMTVPIDRSFCLVRFSDGVDPILLNTDEIRRWDAETETAKWTLDIRQQAGPLIADARKIRWPWQVHRQGFSTGDKFDQQPFVLGQLSNQTANSDRLADATSTPIDFDNDGEVDILLASRESAWLLAVSGRTGKVLWLSDRGPEIDPKSSTPWNRRSIGSAVLSSPLPGGDLDNDGIADVITMFGSVASDNVSGGEQKPLVAHAWMEAISGKTGESLWRSDVDPNWLKHSSSEKIPYAYRWFVGLSAGGSSRGWGPNQESERTGLLWRTRNREYIRTGQFCAIPDAPKMLSLATPASVDSVERSVVYVAGSHVVTLDPKTGKPTREPRDIGIRSDLPIRYAEMDGDGMVDLVVCEQLASKANDIQSGVTGRTPQVRVSVWSLAKNQWIWKKDFAAHWPRQVEQGVPAPQWPLVQDLNGDGTCELIIPNGTTCIDDAMPSQHAPWGELAVVDGSTGEISWQRRIFTLDQQIDHMIAGPDLDGDGTREVFVASLWGNQYELFVDAFSGADGKSIWRQQYSLKHKKYAKTELRLGQLGWWNGGKDGWPQLMVPLHPDRQSSKSSSVLCFSAGDGSLQQRADGTVATWFGDVNRDQVDDLFSYSTSMSGSRRIGQLSVYHGVAKEYWRRANDKRFPVCDLNGDGIRDMLRSVDNSQLKATSGLSGETLWTTELGTDGIRRFEVVSQHADTVAGQLSPDDQQARDFDQDGTPDLLIGMDSTRSKPFSPLHAVSGRTGHILWQADLRVTVCRAFPMTLVRDLDVDGRNDVVFVGAMNVDYPKINELHSQSPEQLQLWLVVINVEDGSVKWKRPLSPAYGSTPQFNPTRLRMDMLRFESPTTDLNGDGTLDLVLPSETNVNDAPSAAPSCELLAISGLDGATLWRHPLSQRRLTNGNLLQVPPAISADIDGDGSPEVIVLEFEDTGDNQRIAHTIALEGGSGRLRWKHKHKVDSSYGEIDDQRERRTRPRPLAIAASQGRSNIGTVLRISSSASPFELDIIDHEGASFATIPLSAVPGYVSDTLRVYSHDVDGDGLDEVLFWNRRGLVAARCAPTADVVWECPLPTRFNAELEGLLHPSPGVLATNPHASTAVLRHGIGDNSLTGVDVATGTVDWVCVGPTARSGDGWRAPKRVELMGNAVNSTPVGLFQFTHLSVCRQAAAIGERRLGGAQGLVTGSPVAIGGGRIGSDPRGLRDLPWMIRIGKAGGEHIVEVGKLTALYCIFIVIIPVAVWVTLLRRRKLDRIAIAGFAIALISIGTGASFRMPTHIDGGPWLLALVPVPLLAFLVFLAMQITQRRWRRALAWIACAGVLSVALAIVVLYQHSSHAGLALQSGERYSTNGWYLIGLWGTYLAGFVILLTLAARHVFRFVLRGTLRQPE